MFSLYVIQFRGYSWDVPKNGEERFGGLAQLGERLPCKQEVSGSIPLISTRKKNGSPFEAQRSGFDGERRNKATDKYLMLALNM